ncbi:substrate-binding periplasmic protein [Desulfobotulus alkaliphilus]|nr:transporter substrate-binding domain-containing protein [Desulfobotulus alkaliphilus]
MEKLHVGILDLPPLYEVGADGKPGGVLLEFLTRILDQAGYSYDMAVYPPRRLYWNIAEGRCHVFLGVKNVPELEGRVLYSKKKITDIDMRAYVLGERKLPEKNEDLYGSRVIVIRGYSYGGFINDLRNPDNGVELMEASDHIHAFRQLAAGRGDYLLDYRRAAENAIRVMAMEEEVRSTSLELIGVFLKVSKQVEGADILMQRLEAAWDYLESDIIIPGSVN